LRRLCPLEARSGCGCSGLGAGDQSTTLAPMAAHGIIDPMPDCAVFADTGWKPTVVYDHLASLTSPNALPFLVYIVSAATFARI
jgi:hypothetical protein